MSPNRPFGAPARLSLKTRRQNLARRYFLPRLEHLEDRSLPSASFAPDPLHAGKFVVQLAEDIPGTADLLAVRVASGQLQYKLNGAGFTSDLDSTTLGTQALALSDISRIDVTLGGGGDTFTLDFSGGNPIPTLAGIHYNAGTGTDTITAAHDANFTLTDSSLTITPGGVVSLISVEQANLTGGNSPNVLDASAFNLGAVTLDGGNQDDTVRGGAGNDLLTGTQGTDNFFGNGGNDTIFSGNSGSNVSGGAGDDTIIGANGKDIIHGDAGNDTIVGNNGADELFGDAGNDRIEGGLGNDLVDGGADTDTVVATGDVNFTLSDTTLTGLGTDTLVSIERAELTGGVSNNTIDCTAFTGVTVLYGGGGTDTLLGGSGENSMSNNVGGSTTFIAGNNKNTINLADSGFAFLFDAGGDDTISFAATGSGITLDMSQATGFAQNVDGNGFMVALNGTFETFIGSAFSDAVIGNDANNVIIGAFGDDNLAGGAGADLMWGDDPENLTFSNDLMWGEDGDDQMFGGPGSDLMWGDDPDNLTFSSDLMFGDAGPDTFVGGGGNDHMTGGDGDDTYLFIGLILGDDTITEAANLGVDTLNFSGFGAAVTVDLALTTSQVVNAGNLSLAFSSDTGIENVVGSRFADTIYGNSRDNQLLGAQAMPDWFVSPIGWDGVTTQAVYLDFDTYTNFNPDTGLPENNPVTGRREHVYSDEERDEIQARLTADYAAFHFTFMHDVVPSGDYVTLFFNKTPIINGEPQPGGLADEVDFRNLNKVTSAAIDVNGLLGGAGQPEATDANFAALSATIAAHEQGHTLGLRHLDSAGPIGSGLPPSVPASSLRPAYPGPTFAAETGRHIMSSPGSVGTSLFDSLDQFFGEREAIKLALNETILATSPTLEASAPHQSIGTAQPLVLQNLLVPNTLESGLHYGLDFAVAAAMLTGEIHLAGAISEDDYYSFTGKAGELFNIEVISNALTRISDPNGDGDRSDSNAIDSIVRVYNSGGTLVAYYTSVAENDDELESQDSILIDLILPSDGTFYIQVDTFWTLPIPEIPDGVPDTDVGQYELLVSRFAVGNATDLGDYLEGRGGNDVLDGGLGDDTIVAGTGNDTVKGGAGLDTVVAGNVANTWSITATNGGTLNGTTTFAGTENLTGGSNTDIFVFTSGATVGVVNGGGGSNFLSYASFTSGVTVDLAAGTATGTGGFGNIQHAIGGAGNDMLTGNSAANILIGNGGNDTLWGNDGRDILIGGDGADFLDGGNDDDILIGGRTGHDANTTALLTILQEWTRLDLAYGARMDHITGKTTGGLNGAFLLNSATLFDDNKAIDTIWGRGGLDWFITGPKDDVKDKSPGETVTKI